MNNPTNKVLTFKNNSTFKSGISKTNDIFIGNAEDLDTVMPMYNLLEYSGNYCMTSGSLWNYYGDEMNDDDNESNTDNYWINNSKTAANKSFEYKTKIIGSVAIPNNALDKEVFVTLSYLINIWRSLDWTIINCEIELDLSWLKNCIVSQIFNTPKIDANPAVVPPITHVL